LAVRRARIAEVARPALADRGGHPFRDRRPLAEELPARDETILVGIEARFGREEHAGLDPFSLCGEGLARHVTLLRELLVGDELGDAAVVRHERNAGEAVLLLHPRAEGEARLERERSLFEIVEAFDPARLADHDPLRRV